MQRLKTRTQFQAVLAGEKVATTAHFALHRCAIAGPTCAADQNSTGCLVSSPGSSSWTDVWLGAMVPKRWAKRAVTRNTIKRQIYHVSSEFQSAFPAAAHVVRLRAGFDNAVFLSAKSDALKSAVRQELMRLFFNARQGRVPSGLSVPDQ